MLLNNEKMLTFFYMHIIIIIMNITFYRTMTFLSTCFILGKKIFYHLYSAFIFFSFFFLIDINIFILRFIVKTNVNYLTGNQLPSLTGNLLKKNHFYIYFIKKINYHFMYRYFDEKHFK